MFEHQCARRSTRSASRMDLVQCEQPEPLHAGRRAGAVPQNPPPPAHQCDGRPAQCHSFTGNSEGKSCPRGEAVDPGPAALVRIWCVWCVSCSRSEASGGGGLSAALHRWEWEPGPSRGPDTESVLSEQRLSEWTLTGAVPNKACPHLTPSLGLSFCSDVLY